MKSLTAHRVAVIFLSLMMALLLAACGKQPVEHPTGEIGKLPEVRSDREKNGDNVAAPESDPGKSAASLALLQECMTGEEQIAGAVAYLGYRGPWVTDPLTSWLRENCAGLTEELPFLLEIPEERILGAGYGDLYCIIPRDESTSLAVNHVTWESQGNGVWPVTDEVLYREEYAQPVLVFVNCEEWPDEPDTEISLVASQGLEVSWCPLTDAYGCPIVPTGVDYAPMLMVLANSSDSTEQSEPAGDDWWLPPTDVGLADTTWVCDGWMMDLHDGGCDSDYAGIAELYRRFEDNAVLTRAYTGVWRMEDDCLYLAFFSEDGDALSGSFPILISPSGEEMVFQRSRSGEGVPFLPDDMDSIDLTRSYG